MQREEAMAEFRITAPGLSVKARARGEAAGQVIPDADISFGATSFPGFTALMRSLGADMGEVA